MDTFFSWFHFQEQKKKIKTYAWGSVIYHFKGLRKMQTTLDISVIFKDIVFNQARLVIIWEKTWVVRLLWRFPCGWGWLRRQQSVWTCSVNMSVEYMVLLKISQNSRLLHAWFSLPATLLTEFNCHFPGFPSFSGINIKRAEFV